MKKKLLLLTIFLLHLFLSTLTAQTPKSGNQSGTWTKAQSPYVISGTITVPAGQTLIIEAGVEVRSNSMYDNITINGTLIAKGTVSDSIRFRGFANPAVSPSSTHGGALYFNSGSINSIVEYVSMDRWGDVQGNLNNGAIYINTSGVSITKCKIRNSEGIGIKFENSTISPSVSANSFENNPSDLGVYIHTTKNVVGNINAKILLIGGSSKQDGILQKQGANSYFKMEGAGITISVGDTLEVKPGVELRSYSISDNLSINGTLIAKGLSTDSIKLRGFADLTASPSYSHGGSISFSDGSINSVLEYVSIDRWGDIQGNNNNGAIYINTSGVSISNSIIRNSEERAIRIANNSISPTIANNNFVNNPQDISAFAQTCSNIYSNTNSIIYLNGGTSTQSGVWKKQGINSYFKLYNSVSITIRKEDTLDIKPGVEVRSNSMYDNITINGTLIAKGTVSDSIRFRGFANPAVSSNSTHGGALYFNSGSINSIVEYVSMDKWGDVQVHGNNGAIYINTSGISITKCKISNSEGIGIKFENSAISPLVSANSFENNPSDLGVYIHTTKNVVGNINAKILLIGGSSKQDGILQKQGVNSYFKMEGVGITISVGDTLEVKPGVELRSYSIYDSFSISGTLIAKGLSTDSIKLRGFADLTASPSYSHGGSISFNGGSINSILEYVSIDKWGDIQGNNNNGAIYINTSGVSISNSIVRNSEGMAIRIANNSISPTIANNNFVNNPQDISAFVENCATISNNKNAKITINGGYISTNSTLPYPGINSFYLINSSVTVPQTYTLTIEAGTTIEFGSSNPSLDISGTLRAMGTELSPIQFYRNQIGFYNGNISLAASSTGSILSYVSFDKLGGNAGYPALDIATSNFSSSNLTFSNCYLGIRYQGGNAPIFSGSNFYNNRIGIQVDNGRPTFNNCNIYGNTDYGINNTSGASADTVDARNCYWGTPSGPYHPTLNTSGLGNRVSDKVKFKPIRTQPQNGQVLDIGISTVLSPITDCNLTNTADITVRVSNYGNVSVSSFPVSYKVNNGSVVNETVSGASLLPGRTFDYTFTTKANLSTVGNYNITAYTKLSNDSLKTNDTTKVRIDNLPNITAPTSLIPTNGSVGHDIALSLSWSAVANATGYDLYVWKATEPVPTTPLATGVNQINYSLPYGTLSYGTQYNWKVVAKRVSCQATSVLQTFTTRQLPDLEVQDITVPPTATSETDISIRFKIRNVGTGSTGSVGWQDVVYLTDQVDNFYVGSFSNLRALNANESYETASFTFRIPQGVQGNYKVVTKTNYSNSLIESNSTNNERISNNIAITLAPPPDLQVVAPVLVSSQNLFSEDSLTVTYKVKNFGSGPTTKNNWIDYVYLSQNEVLNTNTATLLYSHSNILNLSTSAEYSVRAKTKLPARISGTYYIHVFTDVFNNIFEYNKENNNIGTSLPVNVIQKPTPDLTVGSVTFTADSISNNQLITIQWNTTNNGAITALPSWQENIYISNDAIFNLNTDPMVGSITRNTAINSLSSTVGQQSVNIPSTLQEGNYYFFVKTDAYDGIYENPDETNNISPASSVIRVINTDLRPTLFNVPATAQSEQSIVVQWKVKNDSRGNLINNTWNDKVYLSSNNTFEPTDLLLGSTQLNQLLGKGAEYNKQISITLPTGISGTYYLILVSDADNNIYEKLENNNIEVRPITISLAPWADLQVSTIAAPSIDTVGTTIKIQYSLKNAGLGNIINKSWTDNVYLSPTNNVNETNLTFIGSVAQNRSIASNQTITQSAAFGIPSLPEGTYYVIVKTDINNTVFENTGENNNAKIATSGTQLKVIVVAPPMPIDLSVSGGRILSSTVTAGQSVNIEWSVRNNSTVATSATVWKDAIYLSNSSVLNANAELLATVNINGSLAAGASYTRTATVNIPQTASGTLYLLVNTDKDNQNNDAARGNNTLALSTGGGGQAVVITIPPPADLVPTVFTTSVAQGVAAQPVNVSFTIKNQGTGTTPTDGWVEQVYLSTDVILGNGNDQLIGTIPRSGSLVANATYSVSNSQIFLPSGISGNYVLILKTDGGDNVFERNNEGNNLAFANILINVQQPSDLKVSDINVPVVEQYAGTNTTISWNVKNIGSNTANGFKRDAVYFSKDSLIDATDVLFGILDKSIFLPNQATDNNSLTKTLSNITVGEYYVIVKSDILNSITEINEENNQTIAVGKLKVRVKELPIGSLTSDTLSNNSPLYYQLTIPQNLVNETLSISLKGDSALSATNRMFLSLNKVPDANKYEYSSTIPFKANQEIIVPTLSAGVYYLTSLGNHPSQTKQQVTLFAKIIPFSITSINANKGGNTGSVTVKIEGAKFEKGMVIRLSKQSNVYTATSVYYVDQSKLYATFNLNNAPVGLYTVSLQKSNNSTTQLVDGFEVISGSPGGVDGGSNLFSCSIQNIGFDDNIQLDVVHPESVRRNQLVKITVAYANNGNVDIPVQTRMILSLEKAPINFLPDFAKDLQELILEFKESDGPPDILRAGASGFINIYSKATAPLSFIITK
ncbi:MAG: CARDB domain-containing protein [Flectobacillus sp.]|nr:CARDB domain-containing protein [Flectobacillus sp.]